MKDVPDEGGLHKGSCFTNDIELKNPNTMNNFLAQEQIYIQNEKEIYARRVRKVISNRDDKTALADTSIRSQA